MNELFPDVFQVFPSKATPGKYRSFFVRRAAGNLLFPCFSASSTIEAHFADIDAQGGLSRQLLGDSHFRSPHCDVVAAQFNAPLYCSEPEAPDVMRTVRQVVQLPFVRQMLEPDVEVVPTPGHRPGGLCFMVSIADRRFLFAGDFIWHDGSRWIPTASKSGLRAYRDSLRLLADIPFDVLFVNAQVSNDTCFIDFKQHQRDAFFAGLLAQLPPA
ncbi:MAG: MBL fold metallo-hydrolase [Pleurocapsa minor GSE-CHR-MK-17-07R]|jgi:hypothetical protein|nr:MBL fold metallo-hydrolase [Pleurocapsa minor GSE-CHR-MK 17-07R]